MHVLMEVLIKKNTTLVLKEKIVKRKKLQSIANLSKKMTHMLNSSKVTYITENFIFSK